MVFTPPSWVPQLPNDPPDNIPIGEFLTNDAYGRHPIAESRNPYTCGLTGRTYTAAKVVERTDLLARAFAKRLGYSVREGTEWDKVVGLFALNTIDYIPATHAVHRLSGIVTPASAAYSADELAHQLQAAGANALLTCVPLLETALAAAKTVGIAHDRIFILPLPGFDKKVPFATIEDLIEEGKALPELPALNWVAGQGARQVAYLCFSSGTSGLPKAVMVSHRNVIANTMQMGCYESVGRKALNISNQTQLGLLPMSHIYGLGVASWGLYRGDQTVVMPRFELKSFLEAIQKFRIQHMAVVPPILIQLLSNRELCSQYDLTSVRFLFSGAAPLGAETLTAVQAMFPSWKIFQGYGLTETSPVVCITDVHDIFNGSSGSILPDLRVKLIDPEGNEVTAYDTPGEILVQGSTVVLGYLHNEKATAETFIHDHDGRWMKTGDEGVIRKSAKGYEHIFITDRIKELIKVKGLQVAPAELEAHLLAHPLVDDCAVIQVPDDRAGEVPKAYVTKSAAAAGKSDQEVTDAIHKHVQDNKARHKWLKGGIEFIDVVPKSPSGKILRRLLRDKEKQARKAQGAKL